MKVARFLERGGAIAMAAALVVAAPAAALADGGPGGGPDDGGPAGGAECAALQTLVQAHPGWARAFPTLEVRLEECGTAPAGPPPPGPDGKAKRHGPPGPVQFVDLKGYSWAEPDVTLLAQLGIIMGEGNDMFGPGQQITRVQFAELMQRMFNLPEPSSPVSFVDVTPSTPGYGAIEAAAPYMTQFNTLGGVAFEPNLPEVRIEVAATIGEVEVAEHVATLPSTTTAAQIWSQFSDGSMVPPGLLQASAIAVEQGLMKGYPDGSFGVDDPLSRADAAVLLARLLESNETIGSTTTTTTTSSSAPTVTGISPQSGPGTGGTTVTVTGTGFVPGASVLFAGSPSPSVTFVSADELQAVSPAGSGTVDVVVAESTGTSPASAADQFTYVSAAPAVTSVSPSTGPTTGGTDVTIMGSNFASDATVLFNGTAATSVTYVNSGELRAVSPAASAAGTVNVVVAQPSGTSATTSADQFTYVAAAPVVTSISPSSGPTTGGTTVTITGSGFASDATVLFNGTAATSVTYVNAGELQAVSPAASAAGTVNVFVTQPSGTSSATTADLFTYTASSTSTSTGLAVTGISPQSGPAGQSVLISGTGFGSGDTVTFGPNQATGVTVYNSTTITALAPAGSGTVAVTVYAPNGAAGSTDASFTYN